MIIPRKIIPEYLFAYLKTKFAANQLVRRATASMYPAVTENDVRNLVVPIPTQAFEDNVKRMVNDLPQMCFEKARNFYMQALAELYEATYFRFDLESRKAFFTTYSKNSSNSLDVEIIS